MAAVCANTKDSGPATAATDNGPQPLCADVTEADRKALLFADIAGFRLTWRSEKVGSKAEFHVAAGAVLWKPASRSTNNEWLARVGQCESAMANMGLGISPMSIAGLHIRVVPAGPGDFIYLEHDKPDCAESIAEQVKGFAQRNGIPRMDE